MEIREDRPDDVLVVAPAGRIDSNSSGGLERRLLEHVSAGETRIVMDLQDVDYISSAGLRVLLLAANKLRPQGGQIVLCSLGRSVREVFDIAGFTSILSIEPSRELALARLQRKG
jgi:stage II sporulation protein AA (anti-sigma F factor antagonist)